MAAITSDVEDTGFGINSMTMRDDSIATITNPTVLNILPSIHPVFSSDGIDNRIVEYNDLNGVFDNLGSDFDDMNAYGQQNLLVRQVLKAGGTAYVCRLMPSDAKYAHFVLKVGIKQSEAVPLFERDAYGDYRLDDSGQKIPITHIVPGDPSAEPPTMDQTVPSTVTGIKFKVIVEPVSESDQNSNSIRILTKKYSKVVTDDGYTVVPLLFASYYARGRCGENYGMRIINDFARDEKVNDGRRYQMFLLRKTKSGATTLSIGDGLSFSWNPKATISQSVTTVEGLQKVYRNYDGRSEKQIQIESYQDNYATIINEITSILSQDIVASTGVDITKLRVESNPHNIDFINGMSKDGYTYDNVEIDATSVKLGNPQYFKNGSDGEFETLTGTELVEAKDELLKKFFSGDIDTANLLDVLRCDAGIMYDANYNIEIKKAMIKFIQLRRDICSVFDCGETENLQEAIAVVKDIRADVGIGGENYCIIPHFGTSTDDTVDRRVSATYEFAYGLTNLYRSHPYSIYAGKQDDAGCVRRMLFDWVVEESKPKGLNEKLAKQNRLYYAIDLGKAVSSPATGNTTGRNIYFYSNASLYKEEISKLTEFRNGILINDIRRMLKLVLVKYTFDTTGADLAINKANAELSKVFSSRYPANIKINIRMFQSERDVLLNHATCQVEVIFPDVFETWNCTIIAGRNVVQEAA